MPSPRCCAVPIPGQLARGLGVEFLGGAQGEQPIRAGGRPVAHDERAPAGGQDPEAEPWQDAVPGEAHGGGGDGSDGELGRVDGVRLLSAIGIECPQPTTNQRGAASWSSG